MPGQHMPTWDVKVLDEHTAAHVFLNRAWVDHNRQLIQRPHAPILRGIPPINSDGKNHPSLFYEEFSH